MSGDFDKMPTAIVGRLGEEAGSEILRADGASVISLCRIDSGGAPMLERGTVRRDNAVLPDLQAFNWEHATGAVFVEIKTYAQSREFRAHGIWIHGIPVRLYEHYTTKNITGLPVFLGVNELDTGTFRVSAVPLHELPKYPCMCSGCKSGRAHIPSGRGIQEVQWYFDREDLSIVYKHSDRTIERLRKEHSRLIGGHTQQRHGLDRFPPKPTVKLQEPAPPESGKCYHCLAQRAIMIAFEAKDRAGNPISGLLCRSCWSSDKANGRIDADNSNAAVTHGARA